MRAHSFSDLDGRCGLHVDVDVRVGVHGYVDVRVAKPFLNDLRVNPSDEGQRRLGVAKAVEPDPGQACLVHLPIPVCHAECVDAEEVRVVVYESFSRTGRAPDLGLLATRFAVSEAEIEGALRVLAANRHLVLGTDGSIAMAHPFASVPLGFSVMGRSTLWWGGCAWDSFALPHLMPWEGEVLVATRCPACEHPHTWSVGTDHPPAGDQVAHFLVPAASMWDDVVHTCGNQRIFCSRGCVGAWLHDTGQHEGYVMDLPTLWHFAAHWYQGRLEHGYVRREPSAAHDYMRSVGLSGPFWGL